MTSCPHSAPPHHGRRGAGAAAPLLARLAAALAVAAAVAARPAASARTVAPAGRLVSIDSEVSEPQPAAKRRRSSSAAKLPPPAAINVGGGAAAGGRVLGGGSIGQAVQPPLEAPPPPPPSDLAQLCSGVPLANADMVLQTAMARNALLFRLVANVSVCFRTLRFQLLQAADQLLAKFAQRPGAAGIASPVPAAARRRERRRKQAPTPVPQLLPVRQGPAHLQPSAPPYEVLLAPEQLAVCSTLPRAGDMHGALDSVLGRAAAPLLADSAEMLLKCVPRLQAVVDETLPKKLLRGFRYSQTGTWDNLVQGLLKLAFYAPAAGARILVVGRVSDSRLLRAVCAPVRPTFCIALLNRTRMPAGHVIQAGDSLAKFFRDSRCSRSPAPDRREMCRAVQATMSALCKFHGHWLRKTMLNFRCRSSWATVFSFQCAGARGDARGPLQRVVAH